MGQAGDGVDGLGLPPAGALVASPAHDLDDLGGMREGEPVDGDRFEGAQLHAAVRTVAGAVQHGHTVPGQSGAAGTQAGLVAFDGQQVVGVLAGHEELGVVALGVQRVGGHHRPGQVECGQQRSEAGDLAGGAGHGALGQHDAGGVVHAGELVEAAAVLAGAAQGLAVDRDRPPTVPLVGVGAAGQPGAEHGCERFGIDAGQDPADRGLLRWTATPGERVAAGPECCQDRLGQVSSPFADRGQRPGAGQHRGRRDGEDAGQRVSAATAGAWVGQRGQAGQQVGGLAGLQWSCTVEVGQAGGDR
jgi:hypothetical protein